MLKIYNLTATDTIYFGASPSEVFESAPVHPGHNSLILVREIYGEPYEDYANLICYVGKNDTIAGYDEGSALLYPGSDYVTLTFLWDGNQVEFMD